MLGDLEQRFNSLEEGGKSLVTQVMNYSHCNQTFVSLSLFHLTCIFLVRQNVWQLSRQQKDGLGSKFATFLDLVPGVTRDSGLVLTVDSLNSIQITWIAYDHRIKGWSSSLMALSLFTPPPEFQHIKENHHLFHGPIFR